MSNNKKFPGIPMKSGSGRPGAVFEPFLPTPEDIDALRSLIVDGVPMEYDYELGRSICQICHTEGLPHTMISCQSHQWMEGAEPCPISIHKKCIDPFRQTPLPETIFFCDECYDFLIEDTDTEENEDTDSLDGFIVPDGHLSEDEIEEGFQCTCERCEDLREGASANITNVQKRLKEVTDKFSLRSKKSK
jgi:hypothetical protein